MDLSIEEIQDAILETESELHKLDNKRREKATSARHIQAMDEEENELMFKLKSLRSQLEEMTQSSA